MKKILILLLCFYTLNSHASEWLLYKAPLNDSVPELKFTPYKIIYDIPECKIITSEKYPDILLVDCEHTYLKAGFIFVKSHEMCDFIMSSRFE
jgi:hypothetical protein